ncbi:HipA domain-containing protein [Ruminococcus sp.]|uniref:HipA domain-containing protein n=1 Tax=Ruminococcus sp. TaxID=41978 RepID=UPI0025DEA45C|nr:HipA domain-containing protein [Ruminococcus sp.]MCR4638032.1 HipA domain-containing protein [Ruminococcus sp.]
MHKNIAVADIDIDETLGGISKIRGIISKEHLPVGVVRMQRQNETIDRFAFNQWWTGRSIPASRMGLSDMLDTLGIASSNLLLTKCLGLSLSDHYWIKPYGSDMTWEDVNFFDNDFSDDIGDVLFGTSDKNAGFDFLSPDNTSDGNLKKRWKIIDGKRCLLKSGSNPYSQQTFNEVIASKIMNRLGIDHVPYSVTWINDEPYSVCEDFVTKDTELISAWRVLQLRTKANHENEYLHYVNICRELGIDIVSSIDKMIVLDYIIANEDRHFNNFGLLRDANTLEWLGAAPIFDSGTSLWYDRLTSRIPINGVNCKPFKKTHGEQIKLVSSLEWFEASKLDGIEDEILEVFSDDKAAQYIDTERAKTIAAEVRNRIEAVASMAMSHTQSYDIFSTEGDVEEDVAESYGMKME